MTERIGYNPYFYSYPQYLSNNLGVNNRFSPNFRGDGVGVASPQTSVNYTTPPDTVEISAGNKINEASTQEKQKTGMSTLAKVGITIGGTALAGILAHKFIPPMRVQSRVQRVFLEDFTKEEAKAIQKKYQDILKISDKDEFIDKLFTELKKDYKLDNIPINLDKAYKGEKNGAIIGAAHFLPHHDKGFWEVGIDKNFTNEEILKHLTHELKHAKQDLYQYKTSLNKDELVQVFYDKFSSGGNLEDFTKTDIIDAANTFAQAMEDFYQKLGIKRIDKTDPNWEWGRKNLESYRIYANNSKEAYRTTFYETDAKSTERLMDRMVHNRLF